MLSLGFKGRPFGPAMQMQVSDAAVMLLQALVFLREDDSRSKAVHSTVQRQLRGTTVSDAA
jgi:hypothetical protein